MARPTGVGRAISTCTIPIEGRDEWLAAAGTGSPEQCAAEVLRQMELGADSVILHGAAPAELAPVVEAVLWPVISILLLAPQRRAPNPDANRPL